MVTILIVTQVIICILLTLIVLLQFGKGAETGAVMGQGSSQSIFSSSQKGNFLTKVTTVLAISFMVNSVALTLLSSQESQESVFDGETPVARPLNNDALNEENAKKQAEASQSPAAPAEKTPSLEVNVSGEEQKAAEKTQK